MQIKHINPHYQHGVRTSQKELLDLVKAWVILGVAFAIVMNGLNFNLAFLIALFVSLLTIGIGFLFHELAHKFMAQRYGCFAEFRSFDKMLILALIFSFLGFILAAPGAVMIQGHLTRSQRGRISAAGPGMNIIISILFLLLTFTSVGIWRVVGMYGFIINAWLALFNMIPVAMFDGKKVWDWNKPVYALMAAAALGLIVIQNLISMGIL